MDASEEFREAFPDDAARLSLSSRLDYVLMWLPLAMVVSPAISAFRSGPSSPWFWPAITPLIAMAVAASLAAWHSWSRLRAVEPAPDRLTPDFQLGLWRYLPGWQRMVPWLVILALVAWVSLGDLVLWFGFGIRPPSLPTFWLMLLTMIVLFLSLPDVKTRGWGVLMGRIVLVMAAALPLANVLRLLAGLTENGVSAPIRSTALSLSVEMLVLIVAGRLYAWWIVARLYQGWVAGREPD